MYATRVWCKRRRTRLTRGCPSADTAIATRTGGGTEIDQWTGATIGAMIVSTDLLVGTALARGNGPGRDHPIANGDAAAEIERAAETSAIETSRTETHGTETSATETSETGETSPVIGTEDDAMPLRTPGQKDGGATVGTGTGI